MHISKILEDLLQCRLTHGVLAHVELALHAFDEAENATDRLILPLHSDSDVVAVLLNDFDLSEGLAHLEHALEQVDVGVDLAEFVIFVVQFIEVLMDDLGNLLVEFVDVDLAVGHVPLLNTVQLIVSEGSGLKLDDEAGAELVLDVLCASEALEDTALDENAHLG